MTKVRIVGKEIINVPKDDAKNGRTIRQFIAQKFAIPLESTKLMNKGTICLDETQIDPNVHRYLICKISKQRKDPDIRDRKLCLGGCGFFGDYLNDYYCSMCSMCNTHNVRKQNLNKPGTDDEKEKQGENKEVVNVDHSHVDHSRCYYCKKNNGLLGFKCRCGFTFCSKHRYSNKHDCTFDFRNYERKLLQEKNQECTSQKIQKI